MTVCSPPLMLAAIVAIIAATLLGLILWPLVATLLAERVPPTEDEHQQDDAAMDSVRAALDAARRESGP